MGAIQPENEPDNLINDSGCVQDDSVTDKYTGQAELLDLSDDVLLYILKFCTPRDLKALGHTCPRLGALICDHTLWQRVDARSGPTGQERLSWLLTHCLTPGTQELKLTGYVNRETRCLGIQDLSWPLSGENGGPANSVPGVDVEHFLLRMWYSHLPRYAMSPRWPDKREAAGKAYSSSSKGSKQPLSPLSQLASEIVAGAGSSTSSISDLSNSSRNSSISDPCSSRSRNSGMSPSNSSTSSDNGPDSSTSGTSNSGTQTSNSGTESSDTFASDPVDNMAASCQGPQFTLNRSLLRDLRIKCPNLSSLSLEYCNLDYRNANLRYFPPKLKELSLKGTRCYNLPLSTSYLGKIQDRLPDLEILDISECEWFEPASLLPLSKVRNLRELYMKDCRRLTECVAYASLATRYGFQKLKILDLRGSPVADSEVSALGWLPLLEELYLSPPDDMKSSAEHSHKWDDVLAPFTELDAWETEEPDYYSYKSPQPEPNEDGEEPKEEGETPVPEERLGDVMIGNYITCASLERRIIVIHPNRQYQNENQENNQLPEGLVHEAPVEDQPGQQPPGPAANPQRESPRRPPKRPLKYHCLDLVKRKFGDSRPENVDGDPVEAVPERPEDEDLERPKEEETKQENDESTLRAVSPVPSTSKSVDCTPERPKEEPKSIPEAEVKETGNVIPEPESTSSHPPSASSSTKQEDQKPECSNSSKNKPKHNPEHDIPSTSRGPNVVKRPRLEDIANAATSGVKRSFRIGSTEVHVREIVIPERPNHDGPPNPLEPGQISPEMAIRPYLSRYFDRLANNIGAPPMAVHARPVHDRPNPEGRINAFICDYGEPVQRRGCLLRSRGYSQRNIPRDLLHFGHHLVSDSAVLRFGRAVNDNINYVHIGHNFHANDPGVRPDRSNLRVLSITGYRNITDRSLEHLATSAPNLRVIDFSRSGVTERGVSVFRAIRPNCEIVFSRFGQDT